MNRSVFLKVKIKSLAEEARIIRREERKAKEAELKNSLHNHRVRAVRAESRATQIAYGFLRGRTFRQVESNSHKPIDWTRVKSMVGRYGDARAFDAWAKEAQENLEKGGEVNERSNARA